MGKDVYVRYIPANETGRAPRPDYLTVGTYEKTDAYAGLQKAATQAGAKSGKLSGGALVVVPADKPTSAYFAFEGHNLLMEVYDPTPGVALTLVTSGAVNPISRADHRDVDVDRELGGPPARPVVLALGLGLLAERLTRSRLPRTAARGAGPVRRRVVSAALTAFPATAGSPDPVLLSCSRGRVAGGASVLPGTRPPRLVLARGRRRVRRLRGPRRTVGRGVVGGLRQARRHPGLDGDRRAPGFGGTYHGGSAELDVRCACSRNLFDGAYPAGAFADLGMARLLRIDTAWLLQPLMATLGAGLAFALYAATAASCAARPGARRRVRRRHLDPPRGLLAVGRDQGGHARLALVDLLLPAPAGRPPAPVVGQAALFAIPMAAVYYIFGVAGGVYLCRSRSSSSCSSYGAWVAPCSARCWGVRRVFVVLSVSSFALLRSQIGSATNWLSTAQDIGNLYAPSSPADLRHLVQRRLPAADSDAALAWFLGPSSLGMVAGVVVAARQRSWSVPHFVVISLLVAASSTARQRVAEGASRSLLPATLLAAGVAFAVLAETGRRFEGVVLRRPRRRCRPGSNVMAYRDAWVAPSDRMQELAAIGDRARSRPRYLDYTLPACATSCASSTQRPRASCAGTCADERRPGARQGRLRRHRRLPALVDHALPEPRAAQRAGQQPTPSLYSVARPAPTTTCGPRSPRHPGVLQHWPLGTHADPARAAPCAVGRGGDKVGGTERSGGRRERAPSSPCRSTRHDPPGRVDRGVAAGLGLA